MEAASSEPQQLGSLNFRISVDNWLPVDGGHPKLKLSLIPFRLTLRKSLLMQLTSLTSVQAEFDYYAEFK